MPLDNVLLILKGTSPSAKCIKSAPFDQSFKNVPNDYPCAKCYADVLAPTDTMTQSEGTKKIGAPARDRGSGLRQ